MFKRKAKSYLSQFSTVAEWSEKLYVRFESGVGVRVRGLDWSGEKTKKERGSREKNAGKKRRPRRNGQKGMM